MNVTVQIDPTLRNRTDLAEIVKVSADYLASRDPDAASRVAAQWRIYPDPQGEPKIGLGLSDEAYSTGRVFTANQLVPADIRELRLLQVWGDLLREQSHRGLTRINELINQMEDE